MVLFSRVFSWHDRSALNCERIRAPNVHHIHRDKRLDDDTSRISLSMKETVLCSQCAGRAILLNHKKLVLGQCTCPAVASVNKKVVATVCPHHFDTKSDCNKSSVM